MEDAGDAETSSRWRQSWSSSSSKLSAGLLPAGPHRGRQRIPGRRLLARQQCRHRAHQAPGHPHSRKIMAFLWKGGHIWGGTTWHISWLVPGTTCKAEEYGRWRGRAGSTLALGQSPHCWRLNGVGCLGWDPQELSPCHHRLEELERVPAALLWGVVLGSPSLAAAVPVVREKDGLVGGEHPLKVTKD